MAIDLGKTLRKALVVLQADRDGISRQIAAIETVLAAGGTPRQRRRGRSKSRQKSGRKPMSAAARKAVSQRMKKYWAERRAEATKEKSKTGK